MEAKLYLHHGGLSTIWNTRRKLNHSHKPECLLTVQAVLTSPPRDATIRKLDSTTTVYNDNWYNRIAINHLSHSFQTTTGVKNVKVGYDSLVDAAKVVYQKFSTTKQQELVVQTLENAFPKPILSLVRILMPPSTFTREYFAIFTTIFFAWLVGPSEVKESEIEGKIEKNVVHVKKCRFMEGTNCVGMCINLCKMPSQKFIKNSFGMSVNMVPNFDDMSCDMIFGQDPPAQSDDPALKQPCFSMCKVKQKHNSECVN